MLTLVEVIRTLAYIEQMFQIIKKFYQVENWQGFLFEEEYKV